ncbi:sialate O-acetylesterase [Pedobacter frigiditerrae]|uniref:sialate O-acetylesterase n=1 Tax=Pedobacter frigiditerrae TaxID=2530452 RepID=UPI002930616A|nr:sialate O-acetylesterase [Pedobacter frigiditerrae]
MRKISLYVILILVSLSSSAQIKLPRLISDGMVLQRSIPIKLWGWATPNESVKLNFNKAEYTAKANEKGEWQIKLPAQKAGGPYQMVFTASNKIILKDILFGDVWVCSGQSNMELPMSRLSDKYPDVIANANNNQIRQFQVPDEFDFKQERKDFSNGSWISASPKNVLDFSGVAYFFALEIYKKNHIPIGFINSALGGSPAQDWISESAIKKFPAYYEELQKFKDDNLIKSIEKADQQASINWYKKLNAADEGLKNNWKNTDAKGWPEMNIPGYWADGALGFANGVVWFKKDINVTKDMVGKPAKLMLGRIIDADSVFINGQFAGTTSYQYPPRRYVLSNTILKEGKNTIVVRVVSNSGKGGFAPDKPYELIVGDQTIDLKGAWNYKLGAKMEPTPSQTFVRWKPVGLYNAMISPLTNYAIKGALWYQGEANTNKAEEYKSLMQTLIEDWRSKWNQGDFPFLYVQLPGFMETKTTPTESSWAKLRQQQLDLLTVPNTAMAVAIDLGEWNDIHPLNKQDVGKRLALQAQHLVYGDVKTVNSGPIFKAAKLDKNKITISFNNVGGGLIAKGAKELKYFAVAGADKKYYWANAQIVNNKVVVWSKDVQNPVSVRYAWADNPEDANLYNKANLPASPFEAKVGL